MLSENIRSVRKSKGFSQEGLSLRLHVVRQTVSKWEQGLSVPDADMLIALSEALETPVGVLLGEDIEEKKPDEVQLLAEKLELINLQLARSKQAKQRAFHRLFITVFIAVLLTAAFLICCKSPYLRWDYGDPETAVAGTVYHAFEFLFFRLAPFILAGAAAGAFLTGRKR